MSDSISYQAYEVASLIGEEFSRKRVAEILGCTDRNVHHHITQLIRAAGRSDKNNRNADAIITRFALKNQIIQL